MTNNETVNYMRMGKITSVIFHDQNYQDKVELNLGDYELKQESDKWFAVKKKPKYPTTYEECIGKLPINWDNKVEGYKSELLNNFQKLFICRDVYWKIAGEEMGLVKPWKPDYTNPNEKRFAIHSYVVRGEDGVYRLIPVYSKIGEMRDALGERHILEFPTEEMRDAFYENFKDLIEECNELL